MAAGAVIFRSNHARHAIQRFSQGGGAGFGKLFSAHHVTRAGMFEYVNLTAFSQPVTDHGDVLFLLHCRLFDQRKAISSQRLGL